MTELFACAGILAGILLVCAAIGAVWRFFARQSAEARSRQMVAEATAAVGRQEASPAEAAALAAGFWLQLKEEIPYLPTPKPGKLSAPDIYDAIEATLCSFPSVAHFSEVPALPVPLPPIEERRRHLCVLGKTGSGKTTLLEHLIAHDLAEGHGVGVIAPEGEFFRRLLGLVPAKRYRDVIYLAPGNDRCPLTFNPLAVEEGDDRLRAAEDLFTIFRRSLGDDELGPRMQPILHNSFAALTGRPGATLWDVKRLLEDSAFRYQVASTTEDEYVRAFWLETFPRYPKGSDLPIVNRLDQFLRPSAVRRTLCQSASSFSVRQALAEGRILFVDLFGLGEDTRLTIGQLLLAKVQLELLRREIAADAPPPFFLYCDEFQAVAGTAEGLWRDLLSRGRRYGLALTLATQHPGQLPNALQGEIFGNVGSMVSFALGAKDAQAVRREYLSGVERHGTIEAVPIEAAELIELPVGQAYAKLAGGRAVKIMVDPPLWSSADAAEIVMEESWKHLKRHEAPPPAAPEPQRGAPAAEPESFLE